MTRRAQHYREAERLLSESEDPNLGEYADSLVAKAQVRATLATISDDAYNEYLDLRSLEETSEEMAGAPSPESRDWPQGRRRMSGPGRKRRAVTLPAGAEERAAKVRAARARAQALKAQVSAATSRYVALCRAAGIPVRAIAFLLGITAQRVNQIGPKDDDD